MVKERAPGTFSMVCNIEHCFPPALALGTTLMPPIG